jgi:hypothetical protein
MKFCPHKNISNFTVCFGRFFFCFLSENEDRKIKLRICSNAAIGLVHIFIYAWTKEKCTFCAAVFSHFGTIKHEIAYK